MFLFAPVSTYQGRQVSGEKSLWRSMLCPISPCDVNNDDFEISPWISMPFDLHSEHECPNAQEGPDRKSVLYGRPWAVSFQNLKYSQGEQPWSELG